MNKYIKVTIKKSLLTLLIVLCQNHMILHAYTMSGTVVIKDTTIPIKNAIIKTDTQEVKTNRKGKFELDLIPNQPTQSATSKITINANGYTPFTETVTLTQDSNKKFELDLKTVIKASNQTVFGNREQEKLSYYELNQNAIKRLSEGALFSDTISSIQMLPGVASRGVFDGDIYIRGGNSYEMVGVIDSIPIIQPYFWGGMVSIFNAKIAKKVDFYPGGYDARGGQSLSGLIDVYTKDGNFKHSETEIDVNLTELNVYHTSPIQKDKSTTMISYRRTYYDLFSPLFISSDSGPVNMPYLESFQGKYTHKLDGNNKLKLNYYYFNEGADVPLNAVGADSEGDMIYDARRDIVSTQLETIINKQVINNMMLAYYLNKGNYKLTNENNIDATWSEANIIFRDDLTWDIHPKHKLEMGGIYYDVKRNSSSTVTLPPDPYERGSVTTNITSNIDIPLVLTSLYLQDNWKVTEKGTLMAGLRGDFTKVGEFSWKKNIQPRFSFEYQWHPDTKFKTYYGQYAQLRPIFNRVVNPETGTAELVIPDTYSDQSIHYGAGIEQYLNDYMLFKIEAFYKDYSQLNIDTGSYPERIYENKGLGKSAGVEVMLQQLAGKNLEGWLTYTFSKTRRKDVDGWYTPDFDVTHMATVFADYKLANKDHIISTLKFSTGTPYTPVLSTSTNPNTGAEEYEIGDRFSKRLSDYFRMDVWYESDGVQFICPIPFLPISEEKILGVFPVFNFKGSTRFGLYNIFNNQSQTGYYWSKKEQKEVFVTDLPRMPIFGWKLKF